MNYAVTNPWAPEHRQLFVPREPVSTFIGLTALIEGIGISTALAGAIGGSIVSAGLSIGLSYASQGLLRAKAGSASVGLNTPDVRYSTRQNIPPKRIIYGKSVLVGGALCFEKVSGRYLVQQLMVCNDEIEGIDGLFIGNNRVSFTGGFVPNTILVPSSVDGQPDYKNNLRVSIRLGKDDQTRCPLVHDRFPSIPDTFRQRGIAVVTLEYRYPNDYDEFQALWGQGRYPNAFFLSRGIRVYDGRLLGQQVDNKATWGFSSNDNPALVQADYLRKEYGGRIKSGRIDWDEVFAAADYDDGLIGTKSGEFIKRHTINGLVSLNQSPAEVMSGMLSANRGYILHGGGKMWPCSSLPQDDVLTITDNMLASGVEYRAAKPKLDLKNSSKPRFISSERSYELIEGPILERTDWITEDGEPLPGALELPFTIDHRRVQRLNKAYLDANRRGRTLQISIDLASLSKARKNPIGRPFTFQSELFPQANGRYQVQNYAFAEDFTTAEFACVEYDPAIESDFHPEYDEQDFVETELAA